MCAAPGPVSRSRHRPDGLTCMAFLRARAVASPIAVGPVEEGIDVAIDRLLERREAGVVACPAQVLDPGLREILVLIAQLRGHVDIFDPRLAAERGKHGGDQIAEAARVSGSHVEYAGYRRRLQASP